MKQCFQYSKIAQAEAFAGDALFDERRHCAIALRQYGPESGSSNCLFNSSDTKPPEQGVYSYDIRCFDVEIDS